MAKNDKKKLFEVFEKVNGVNLKEWYDDEYFQKPQQPQGMGKFENIDWRVLYDTLIDNYGVAKGTSTNIGANYGDLTDHEGMLSLDELKHLEEFGLVQKMGAFPVIGDANMDFQTFYNKAKEIWNQEAPARLAGDDSEAPFLRGNEPMSENDDYDFPNRKYTNENLYEYVLEIMQTFRGYANTRQNSVLKAEILTNALEDRYPELRR